MTGIELVDGLRKLGTGEPKLAALLSRIDGQPDLGKHLDALEREGFNGTTLAKARRVLTEGVGKLTAEQAAEAAKVAKELAAAHGVHAEIITAAVAEGMRAVLAEKSGKPK